MEDFAAYARRTGLASTDSETIACWTERHRFTMLELYREGELVYTSFQPSGPQHKGPGFRPDSPRYTLTLADGEAELILFTNSVGAYYTTGSGVLAAGCVGLFFLLFLLGCRRIVRYIGLLSAEIQAMEGGELDHPITIQGEDELTALAASLDSMRLTLRRQQQEEAQAAAKIKNLVTEIVPRPAHPSDHPAAVHRDPAGGPVRDPGPGRQHPGGAVQHPYNDGEYAGLLPGGAGGGTLLHPSAFSAAMRAAPREGKNLPGAPLFPFTKSSRALRAS